MQRSTLWRLGIPLVMAYAIPNALTVRQLDTSIKSPESADKRNKIVNAGMGPIAPISEDATGLNSSKPLNNRA